MKHQNEHPTNIQKAPYTSPELRVYGTISELTKSSAGAVDDGFGGSQNLFIPPGK